ncbi:MAG: hypothetical protein J6U22_08425 [Bacteroidaceae bacterium]|nr:hypothetical protein [Bacteroidaceae bacterium]
MTTICSFDCNQSALKSLIGDRKPVAPVEGVWMNVSAKVFEDQVRKLAYGLMVKDFRRGETVVFTGCTDEMKTFISAACRLAHLNAGFSACTDGNNTVPVSELDYLMSIGGTWSRKYKSSVDRTIARLILGC